jgi:hypothetical protein
MSHVVAIRFKNAHGANEFNLITGYSVLLPVRETPRPSGKHLPRACVRREVRSGCATDTLVVGFLDGEQAGFGFI